MSGVRPYGIILITRSHKKWKSCANLAIGIVIRAVAYSVGRFANIFGKAKQQIFGKDDVSKD